MEQALQGGQVTAGRHVPQQRRSVGEAAALNAQEPVQQAHAQPCSTSQRHISSCPAVAAAVSKPSSKLVSKSSHASRTLRLAMLPLQARHTNSRCGTGSDSRTVLRLLVLREWCWLAGACPTTLGDRAAASDARTHQPQRTGTERQRPSHSDSPPHSSALHGAPPPRASASALPSTAISSTTSVRFAPFGRTNSAMTCRTESPNCSGQPCATSHVMQRSAARHEAADARSRQRSNTCQNTDPAGPQGQPRRWRHCSRGSARPRFSRALRSAASVAPEPGAARTVGMMDVAAVIWSTRYRSTASSGI
ncbi:hypothetical protein TSOC_012960 [Tetrabaena socialis]|uniref:Uncharacterized protein n=1 Tax=Tetrabaena socialis TaxID=47790 RepID=A0A2J7ZLN9_9CHLO|nr:hypothetical protein TSOC_012960 [Tetrabaena socialis]|eukprot:PNH01170.1 hypothetical protein TSOC_012960 [Tetrabaena socialis]